MPPLQQVTHSISHRSATSNTSSTSDESDDKSFVSAEVNTSPPERALSAQSEKAPPPLARALSTLSHDDASDTSSSIPSSAELKAQRTPLARQHTATSPISKPSPLSTVSQGTSYFRLQPSTTGFELRSPSNRRAPASRSSHGIETRSGPPPALITQRSYNSDSPWRRHSPAETPNTNSFESSNDGGIESLPGTNSNAPAKMNGLSAKRDRRNRRSLDVTAPTRTAIAQSDFDQDSTIRTNGRHLQSSSLDSGNNRQQEDLFLNLARSDPLEEQVSDRSAIGTRRQSREADLMRTPRPSSSGQPASRASYFPQRSSIVLDSTQSPKDFPSLALKAETLASLARDRPYSASAHPLETQNRSRHGRFNTDQPSYSSPYRDESTRSVITSRRRSIQSSQLPVQSSPLSQWQVPRRVEESQSRAGIEDGTASTVSTTAPSTVWDELDDLKARIRKIELTGGNIPTTSNAAISTASKERPATADTMLTAASVSPRRRKGASSSPDASVIPEENAMETIPLLQSAVARVKPAISPALYRALETTAKDALTLAAMAGSKHASGNNASSSTANAIDRQLRRKADNMCRSLTELCIALGEEKTAHSNSTVSREPGRPTAPSVVGSASFTADQADANEDPDLNASSRVLNRLQARRTSLRVANSTSPQSFPDSPVAELPVPIRASPSRLEGIERSSSVIRRREPGIESNVNARPLSRAATDAGHRPRKSREYTSDHPLPATTSEKRRSYFSTNDSGHSTPSNVAGTTNNSRLSEARDRRLASMGYGSSPSIAVSHRRLQQVGAEGA